MKKKYLETVTEVAEVEMTACLLAGSEPEAAPGVKANRVGYSEVTESW